MNLLIVSGYWPTQSNSISGIFVVQQVFAFIRHGCDVTVILASTKGKKESPHLTPNELGLPAENVQLVQVSLARLPEKISSWPGGIRLNTWSAGWTLARAIRQLTQQGKVFEGCILHGIRYMGLSVPVWYPLVKGKLVIVIHGVDPFIEKSKSLSRLRPLLAMAATVCHSFVLVGEPLRSHAHLLGLSEDQLQVIGNGTDLPALETLSGHQRSINETRRLVSISNLVELKGIDLNLKALSQMQISYPNLQWEYSIIGDGEERQSLELLSVNLGISEKVTFLGRLDYPETMKELEKADVFSLPSWGEAFGIVYLEAMARMLPVVGCVENGAEDIITSGKDGLLVVPKDERSLYRALKSLLLNPEYCQSLGEAGRNTAEKFTWEVNAERVLEVLM